MCKMTRMIHDNLSWRCEVCIATFEPLIQVKSKAVDTGRESVSRAHNRSSEGPGALRTWRGYQPCPLRARYRKKLADDAADFVGRALLSHDRAKTSPLSCSGLLFFCTPTTMDTLDNSDWDVLIVGTGLQQSLLALYVVSLASQSPRAI
jgi:hypothetical protein